MTGRDIAKIASQCTRYLPGHQPMSVRQRAELVAASPLSLVKNDQYGKGGYVTEFEQEIAQLLGKEAAVFMPSGTMAQQIALRIWCDEANNKSVAFHPTCHLEIHEHRAYEKLHGLRSILLGPADRLATLEDFQAIAEPLSAVLLELPQREIGGQLPTWQDLKTICSAIKATGAKLHLDGARLWECKPYYQKDNAEIASLFDSVYVSFYKILNGFPGAALAGPAGFVDEAKIWLRRHGGNLQQQAVSAISAKIGLDAHLPRMSLYVQKAGEVAEILKSIDGVKVLPEHPPTNMMHVTLPGEPGRWVDAALDIAEQDRIWILGGLPASGKWELNIGEAALQFSNSELQATLTKLAELATR